MCILNALIIFSFYQNINTDRIAKDRYIKSPSHIFILITKSLKERFNDDT